MTNWQDRAGFIGAFAAADNVAVAGTGDAEAAVRRATEAEDTAATQVHIPTVSSQ